MLPVSRGAWWICCGRSCLHGEEGAGAKLVNGHGGNVGRAVAGQKTQNTDSGKLNKIAVKCSLRSPRKNTDGGLVSTWRSGRPSTAEYFTGRAVVWQARTQNLGGATVELANLYL
jgi:hypothetical protein